MAAKRRRRGVGRFRSSDADLYFAPTHSPHGFTHPALSHFDGDAEPVIRELLQNSVDAAGKAGRPCEVRFEIRDIDNEELPGFETYRRTFKLAVSQREQERKGVPPTHDEKTIVDRINRHLITPRIPVLTCVDNGTGITPARMQSLLTSGNSDKGDGGAGSYGLGHHAAFSASDLRYVLYASRFRSSEGNLQSVSSGHAVLATHIHQQNGTKRIHAHDGFWVNVAAQQQLFVEPGEAYPRSVPPMLALTTEAMPDTGMVVCIAGFNEFQREESDPTSTDAIAYVAASNFCDAVQAGTLTVSVCDARSGEEVIVDPAGLERILRPRREERRAPKQGQIQGSSAYAAHETFTRGKEIAHGMGTGVNVAIREIEGNARSRVHLYRKGMWITSNAENLRHNDFGDYMPFDAVVSLAAGDLERHVRSAEGPEHRGIGFKRLDPKEKRRLRQLLRELSAVIKSNLEAKSDKEEFRPEDFAIVQGDAAQTLESVGRTRPGLGGTRQGRGQGGVRTGKKKGAGVVRKEGKARPGSVPNFAWTPSGAPTNKGVFTALFSLREEVSGLIGIRLSVPTGSDQTCDSPLPQRFLQLRAIRHGGRELARTNSPNGVQELTFVPPSQWTAQVGHLMLEIEVPGQPEELAVAQLEVVRRLASKATPEHVTGSESTAGLFTGSASDAERGA
ncbi:MAG: hypothetical protein OXF75_11910 [Acidimicrobiaceae bacterium]|nr:hypothetical protein [Acidimicrobiaceae bacterium]